MACSLLNDVISYFNDSASPVFVCSLDAEKCFDTIWHDALFYKLWDHMPLSHWLLLYTWYGSLKAAVRWKDRSSTPFAVTRGMRQGSVLSSHFFNIFLNDLLTELNDAEHGLRIGSSTYSSFAYADDVTLYSATTGGLQAMIDICAAYATRWRLRFGLRKSKCMVAGNSHFVTDPCWTLGNEPLETVTRLDILGVAFDSTGSATPHVKARMASCSRSFYSMGSAGMAFPGASSDVKAYLWQSACLPCMTYGLDVIPLPDEALKTLDSHQASLVKQSLGLPKRSHHSKLLQALNIPPVSEVVRDMKAAHFNRLMKTHSPARELSTYLMSKFLCTGRVYERTLVGQLIQMGISPIDTVFRYRKMRRATPARDGVVDSLRTLVFHYDFNAAGSTQHKLVKHLCRAF
jgi:hypothetical protein